MLDALRAAWRRSDRLFGVVAEEAWLEQPIPLRQPLLFYLGHLPAFAWNHLGCPAGEASPRAEFDSLFERGIDPVGVDAYTPAVRWPPRAAVIEYRDAVRRRLCSRLAGTATGGGQAADAADAAGAGDELSRARMVVEHEAMHHETLLYMLQELEHRLKRRPADWPALPAAGEAPSAAGKRALEVPGGEARLGAARDSLSFGWDNEFPDCRREVPAFAIDLLPATNADYLEFVRAGGYAEPRLWRAEDWQWRQRRRLARPHSWREGPGGELRLRTLFEDVPFASAAHWPVAVSWAEAAAYAAWRGARLPSEAEWHRAAAGVDRLAGNVGFRHGSPLPVGSTPDDRSAWGIGELAGNGWEWTASAFAPFDGFQPMPRYPGYSADFFDGGHFVLLGGSWATGEALLRQSFRNWFQPHYPYVFSKFRCLRPL